MPTKRVLICARLSLAREESVSIERQVQQAHKYAEARGWEVVGEYKDEGVSATLNKPEARPGWRQVLAYPEHFDAVLVLKIDRLARRVLDFLHADTSRFRREALASWP